MIEHLAVAIVSAIAFLGAILLYGAFSPRRLEGWKFWLCFAAYCVLMEGNVFFGKRAFFRLWGRRRRCGASDAV